MRHVGNVHLQLVVSVRQAADVDGVIEVAGGLAVDSHDGQAAVVAAPVQLAVRNDVLDRLSLFQHFGGKVVRQVELADDDLHVHAEIVFVAEDLDYAPAGILRGRGPVSDLDIHHHVFQIIEFRAAPRFLAKHAVMTCSAGILPAVGRASRPRLGRRDGAGSRSPA